MKKSYRNTTEIAAYASQILGITDLELYERHGKPVETNHVSSFEEALTCALASLDLSDRYETAAILLPCADDAAAVYGQLKNHPAFQMPDGMTLSLLDRNSIHFRKGLTVTTYYLGQKGWNLTRYSAFSRQTMTVRSCGRPNISRRPGHCMSCICIYTKKNKFCLPLNESPH